MKDDSFEANAVLNLSHLTLMRFKACVLWSRYFVPFRGHTSRSSLKSMWKSMLAKGWIVKERRTHGWIIVFWSAASWTPTVLLAPFRRGSFPLLTIVAFLLSVTVDLSGCLCACMCLNSVTPHAGRLEAFNCICYSVINCTELSDATRENGEEQKPLALIIISLDSAQQDSLYLTSTLTAHTAQVQLTTRSTQV